MLSEVLCLWKTWQRKTMHLRNVNCGRKFCSSYFSTPHSVGNVENEGGKTPHFQQFPKGFPQAKTTSSCGFPQARTCNLKILKNFIEMCEHCGKTEAVCFWWKTKKCLEIISGWNAAAFQPENFFERIRLSVFLSRFTAVLCSESEKTKILKNLLTG